MISLTRLQNNGVFFWRNTQLDPFVQLSQIHIVNPHFVPNRDVIGCMISLVIPFKRHGNLYDSFLFNLCQIHAELRDVFRQNNLTFRRVLRKVCL